LEYSQQSPHVSTRGDERTWEFGRLRGWYPLPYLGHPYHMNLAEHSGIVLGVTERGVTQSLLRLGSLAAQHGWHVVVFDPQETHAHVSTFAGVMQAAGCTRLYHFSDTTYRTPFAAESSSPMDDLLRPSYRRMQSPLTFSSALHQDLDIEFNPHRWRAGEEGGASGTYLGFNVWRHPQHARQRARFFLTEMLAYLSEQPPEARPLLLLIKHPELLFESEQILPLCSFMEQGYGSVFVGLRSLADVSSYDAALLENARTVIAHRSHPTWKLKRRISLPRWQRSLVFDRIVCGLPDDECFVLHAGHAMHVRVTEDEDVVGAKFAPAPGNSFPPTVADPPTPCDDEVDAILASLFGPAHQEEDVGVTSQEMGHSCHHARSLVLYSPDQAHLRRVLSLLGREDCS